MSHSNAGPPSSPPRSDCRMASARLSRPNPRSVPTCEQHIAQRRSCFFIGGYVFCPLWYERGLGNARHRSRKLRMSRGAPLATLTDSTLAPRSKTACQGIRRSIQPPATTCVRRPVYCQSKASVRHPRSLKTQAGLVSIATAIQGWGLVCGADFCSSYGDRTDPLMARPTPTSTSSITTPTYLPDRGTNYSMHVGRQQRPMGIDSRRDRWCGR